jgi:hypothetical protein
MTLLGAAAAVLVLTTSDPNHDSALHTWQHAGIPAGPHVGP